MYNVVMALATWADSWVGRVIHIHFDNMAVVHTINSLWAKDAFLAKCLRNILMILARYGIHMYAVHVPGVKNRKADALSRLMINFEVHAWVLGKVSICQVPHTAFILDDTI